MRRWFEYNQHPIDGHLHVTENLCSHILVEAHSYHEANRKMERFGCVFGEDYGYDDYFCRWYRSFCYVEFPSYWGNMLRFDSPEEYCEYLYNRYKPVSKHMTSPHSIIHYRNGHKKEIGIHGH